MVAIGQVVKQMLKKNPDYYPIEPKNYDRFLVISLGTGTAKNDHKYSAQKASKWGIFGWLYNGGHTPLVDAFNQASADMVNIHSSIVFQALHSENNYLRIQVNSLTKIYIRTSFFLSFVCVCVCVCVIFIFFIKKYIIKSLYGKIPP